MSHRQKPLPKWTIWIQKPHPLVGSSRKKEAIEKALKSVYGLDCEYLGYIPEYHQIQVYKGSKTAAQHAVQALLFTHHTWIEESSPPPWNGVCSVEVTEESERPEWVVTLDQEREQRFMERSAED